MTRPIHITVCLLLLLFTTACSKSGQNSVTLPASSSPSSPSGSRITSESVVTAEAQPLEIAAGGSADAVIRVTIKSGYHVNANPPTYPYLKATELEIPPADGVSVGFVTYPRALNRNFAFAEKPLAVYEGDTQVKAMLKADKSAKPGRRAISARLRIQACDEQVCYAPGTVEFAVPVNIK